MATKYTRHIKVAVPETLIDEANHLACLLGEGASDINTFTVVQRADELGGPLLGPATVNSEGVAYAVVETVATDNFFRAINDGTVMLPPTPPHAQGIVDRVKAQVALDSLSGDGGIVLIVDEPEAAIEEWIEPTHWTQNPVMTGDQRVHNGKTWESLTDYNVWEPPIGWREVVDTGYPAWVQPTGAHDAYQTGEMVTHDNPNDSGTIWVYSSKIDANTTEPGRDGTFDRWWEPVQPA